MKSEFLEFYHPDEEDLLSIKADAVFMFDSCALLNLYKSSAKGRSNVLKIISKLSEQGRIWQPHQFCYEYQQHRQEVIKTEVNNYADILKDVERYFKDLDKVTMKISFPKHPLVKMENLIRDIKNGHKNALKENILKIGNLKNKHPDWSKKDPIQEKLTTLFSNKIGRGYTDEELDAKYSEGETRYKKFKPPGYMDAEKDKDDITKKKKYGDLIAWFQILDKAKELQKPIVLVSDDLKEDWWRMDKKKNRHGPRKELVKEMYSKTGVFFHMMDTEDLLLFAGENLQLKISKKTIEDIKEVKKLIQDEKEKESNMEDASPLINNAIETSSETGQEIVGTANLAADLSDLNKKDDLNKLPEDQV